MVANFPFIINENKKETRGSFLLGPVYVDSGAEKVFIRECVFVPRFPHRPADYENGAT
ncbi:MAG: hypothetical protein QXP44_07270 [Candidatus Bathyarchaeia archaeon]